MEVNSEKTFYEINVTEAFRTVDADVVLWGEDLHDAKIVLYPKKITALPGYGETGGFILQREILMLFGSI